LNDRIQIAPDSGSDFDFLRAGQITLNQCLRIGVGQAIASRGLLAAAPVRRQTTENDRFRGAWRAQVEGVRVREDLRNRRIGTRLMEWAIGRARERGCRLVQLTSNKSRLDARRFYERLGFSASHVGMKLYL